MTSALLVAAGGAVGAPLRYVTDRWVQRRFGPVFPVGTLVANVAGSLLLGLLTGLAVGRPVMALLGVGLCGALSTYSTFGYETVQLLAGRARWHAVLNVVVNVLAGVGAAILGVLLGQSL